MPNQAKVIAFDVNEASLTSLREALPNCVIEAVKGATAASLNRDWDPGTVDLFVLESREDLDETLRLCHFLVSCGVRASAPQEATDTQEELPETLGLNRGRGDRGRRPHTPLLVLVAPARKDIVPAILKAGAQNCLLLPINAKEVASMLVRAQRGNQPGRHTLNLEKSQTEDRWRDDGGQG